MFALMPAFGAAGSQAASAAADAAAPHAALLQVSLLVITVMVKLLLLVAVCFAVARLVLPKALQLLMRYALDSFQEGVFRSAHGSFD